MRGSARRYVTECGGAEPLGVEQMAANTVVTGYEAMTEEGTGWFEISGGRGYRSGGPFRRGRVDPCGGWFGGRNGRFLDETFRIFLERPVKGGLTGGVNGVDLAVMHLVRGHQPDPGVVVVLVVPIEECPAEASGILDAAEAFWKARLVFQCFEVAFRERIVIRRMRPVMRPGDAQVRQQKGGGFCFHRPAAIGMKRELAGRHVVLFDGVLEQRLEQRGAFRVRHVPSHDPAAEDVDDHVEIKVGSYGVTCGDWLQSRR